MTDTEHSTTSGSNEVVPKYWAMRLFATPHLPFYINITIVSTAKAVIQTRLYKPSSGRNLMKVSGRTPDPKFGLFELSNIFLISSS